MKRSKRYTVKHLLNFLKQKANAMHIIKLCSAPYYDKYMNLCDITDYHVLLIVLSIFHVLNLEYSIWIVFLDTMIFLKKDNILKQNVIYFINHNFKKTPFISFYC